MEMISVIPDIKDAPDAQSMQEVKGNISFENVSFHYADSDQLVLNHVNLEVGKLRGRKNHSVQSDSKIL